MIRALEAIVLPRFPAVVLRDQYTRTSHLGRRFVDAFHIPEEQFGDFVLFLFDELPALLDAADLTGVEVLPHSVTSTLEYFPEIPPRPTPAARRSPRKARARRPATSRR